MEVVIETKSRKKKKLEVTIRVIVERLHIILRSHIGESNSITRAQLFYKVFGITESDCSELQEIVLWDFLKRALHRCRQQTKCFITNRLVNSTYHYFVVETIADAHWYTIRANKTIASIRAMEKRAYKAANEKWSQLEWIYK